MQPGKPKTKQTRQELATENKITKQNTEMKLALFLRPISPLNMSFCAGAVFSATRMICYDFTRQQKNTQK